MENPDLVEIRRPYYEHDLQLVQCSSFLRLKKKLVRLKSSV